jgi:hypothetical protein
MATFVFTDGRVEVNAVNLSTLVRKVTLKINADAPDSTAMGATYHARKGGGLKDFSVDVEFNQDFNTALVDATLFPLLATSTAVKVRSTTSIISATNPEYQGNAVLTDYQPIGGKVGDMGIATANFDGDGALTRAVV